MDRIIIFLVMFATIIGPALAVLAALLGVPITLYILNKRGTKLTAKILFLAAGAMLALPIVAELLAVGALLVLFAIFGQG